MSTKYVVAALIFVHGLVHLLGPLAYWRLATVSSLPYKTSILLDRVEVGARGMQILGIGFTVAAAAFTTVAAGILFEMSWWRPLLFAAAGLSLVVTVIDVKVAYVGAIIDLLILAMLLYR